MPPESHASRPRLTLGQFRLETSRILISGTPPLEDWAEPLLFALWCDRASPWWIGDLLNRGDAAFGERFSQVCQGYMSADQLQRYESVARRVPPENRRDSLSWSAHAAVARLSLPEQRLMLDRAEQEGWNSEELQRAVREYLKARTPQKTAPVTKPNRSKSPAPTTELPAQRPATHAADSTAANAADSAAERAADLAAAQVPEPAEAAAQAPPRKTTELDPASDPLAKLAPAPASVPVSQSIPDQDSERPSAP